LQTMENAENNIDAITKNDPNQVNQVQNIPQAVVADEVVNEQLTQPVDDVDSVINEVISKQAAQIEAPSAIEKMQQNSSKNEEISKVEPKQQPVVEKANATKIIEPKIIQVTPAPVAPKIIAPKPVAPKQVAAAPIAVANAGGSYIQFAALRSAADAGRVWGELKAKHPELIPYSYYTEAVTTATGATLYRLKAKGFASRTQALNICSTIKTRGQDCLVSAN
jgi:hypothetical protein